MIIQSLVTFDRALSEGEREVANKFGAELVRLVEELAAAKRRVADLETENASLSASFASYSEKAEKRIAALEAADETRRMYVERCVNLIRTGNAKDAADYARTLLTLSFKTRKR